MPDSPWMWVVWLDGREELRRRPAEDIPEALWLHDRKHHRVATFKYFGSSTEKGDPIYFESEGSMSPDRRPQPVPHYPTFSTPHVMPPCPECGSETVVEMTLGFVWLYTYQGDDVLGAVYRISCERCPWKGDVTTTGDLLRPGSW
jgi:hypothetical protein